MRIRVVLLLFICIGGYAGLHGQAVEITCRQNVSVPNFGCEATVSNIPPLMLSDTAATQSVTYTLSGTTIFMSPDTGFQDASGTTFFAGLTTVTYVATDTAGLRDSCSFTVEVREDEPPTFTCPLNVIREIEPTDTALVINDIALRNVADNCTVNPVVTYRLSGATEGSGTGDASGTVFNRGATTVTYFVTDTVGNRDSCKFMVGLVEDLVEIECPEDQTATVQQDTCKAVIDDIPVRVVTGGTLIDEVTYTFSGATSNVSPQNGINDASGFGFNPGETRVTYIVRDTNGISSVCDFFVTVDDPFPPELKCPEDTILQTAEGATSVMIDTIPPLLALDKCDDANLTLSYRLSGEVTGDGEGNVMNMELPIGVTTVRYVAIDASENEASCTFDITVRPFQLGIECPANLVLSTPDDACTTILRGATPRVFPSLDQASAVSYRLTGATEASSPSFGGKFFADGEELNIGTTTGTYTAISLNRDTMVSCSFEIEVEDATAPTIEDCPNDIARAAAQDECSVVATWIEPTAFDPCGLEFISTHEPGDTFPVGVNTVTYTATDSSGNTATCAFDVIVEDLTPPEILNCPQNITQELISPDICGGPIVWDRPTTQDACGSVNLTTTHEPGSVFTAGTTQVIYTAEDPSGNTTTCSFTVRIQDPFPPTIDNCPSDITVNAPNNGSCEATATWTPPTIDDNCGAMLTSNFEPGATFPTGETTVTYTVRDSSGNTASCSFTVTVLDDELPVIECPNDIRLTVQNQCDTVVRWTIPQVNDNCGIDQLSGSHNPNSSFPVGITTVTYTATDLAGNETSCSFDVIVERANSLDFCPSDISTEVDPGECTAVVTWSPPVFGGGCGNANVTLTHSPGAAFPVGITTVTYTAMDVDGNVEECSFEVEVRDNEPPVFTNCVQDRTVQVPPGSCTASYQWIEPTAVDNCGSVDLTSTHSSGSTFLLGQTTVRYTATDAAGNTANCQFTITVVDEIPPSIQCPSALQVRVDGTILSDPDDILRTVESNDCETVTLDFGIPTTTDACGAADVQQTDATGLQSGAAFPIGTTILEYTATDDFGNTSACSFSIVVVPLEEATISVSNPQPCAGADVSLTAMEVEAAAAFYNWTGPNGFSASGQNIGIIDIDSTQAGTYEVEINTTSGCVFSGQTTIEVQASPVVEIQHNDVSCTTGDNDLRLELDNDSNISISSYVWTGPNGFQSQAVQPTIPNVTSENAGTYRVVVVSTSGCIGRAMTTIEISGQPETPTLNALPNDGSCVGDTIQLLGQAFTETGLQYHWETEPASGINLSNVNLNSNQAVVSAPGNYTVKYWVDIGFCASDTARVFLLVEESPIVELAYSGDTICVNGMGTVLLSETTGSAASYSWRGPQGFTAFEQNPEVANFDGANTGFYALTARSGNGCITQDSILVEASVAPEKPEIELLTNTCQGDTILLEATGAYAENARYVWMLSDSEMTGTPVAMDTSILQVFSATPENFEAVVFVRSDGCASLFDTLSFSILEQPIVDISQTEDTYNCITQDTVAVLLENGGDAEQWSWTGPNGFSSDSQRVELSVNRAMATAVSGFYTVHIQAASGCTNSDSLAISFSTGINQLSITGPTLFCEGDTLRLSAVGDMPIDATYLWQGPNGFEAKTRSIRVPNVSANLQGEFTVQGMLPECMSPPSAPYAVEILSAPNLIADEYEIVLGQEQVLAILANDTIPADSLAEVQIKIDPFNGLATLNPDGTVTYQPQVETLSKDNFTYEVCYTLCQEPEQLCDEELVVMNINFAPEECVIATVITPNGDGKNDRFIISCVESGTFLNNELIIFNQRGTEVFQAKPYENNWDGTYNGQDLPDGTYYYIFIPEPGAEAQKGFLTIYR